MEKYLSELSLIIITIVAALHWFISFEVSYDKNAIGVNTFMVLPRWQWRVTNTTYHEWIKRTSWSCEVQKIKIKRFYKMLYLYCCLVSHLPAFVSLSLVAKTLMMFRNNIKLTWRQNRNIMTSISVIAKQNKMLSNNCNVTGAVKHCHFLHSRGKVQRVSMYSPL